MAPFDWIALLGQLEFAIYFLIGIGFGLVLESSGFGDSRKLAAQFYLKDMRVFKVMFTGIITTATLVYLTSRFGFLDINRVWINPTYLTSAIAGGLIMGVGFIVGGFCPGTSVVAAATLKLDGIFFLIGVTIGTGIFGETVGLFEPFWNAQALGRFTLSELFNVSDGAIVLVMVVAAVLLFYGAEAVESWMNNRPFSWRPTQTWRWSAAAVLVAMASVVFLGGPATSDTQWRWVASVKTPLLEKREVYVSPLELREMMDNTMLKLSIFDVREEKEFNLFHLRDAKLMSFSALTDRSFLKGLRLEPANTVRVLVDSDEKTATEVWKGLTGGGISNVYILEGGLPAWHKYFAFAQAEEHKTGELLPVDLSLGERALLAHPPLPNPIPTYAKKVKVETKKALKGGCG